MTPERHRRISDVFQQIADLPESQRASTLDRLCSGDIELRRDVESLLEHHHDRPDGFAESNVGAGRRLIADSASPATHLPSHIGRFRILRRIGEGGMGMVFEAEQDQPRRTVALKVIRAGLASDSVVRRFKHEAEVLGRLQHMGIADVYESGVAETPLGHQPYFAMQLIQGRPLIDFAKENRLDGRARLELFTRVCDAVQYAHQRGIIHRDLKPANILVDATGQPKILDFGVARVTEGETTIATMQTATGQVIGTLPYMSPEQISGSSSDVDTRSDVYSLGVSLYELLSERLPYTLSNRTLPEAARIIADAEPARLSTIDRLFRGDVETIVLKALRKDREQRYQSVAELATDIRRYLADEPVLARPPSAMYQIRKFARRHTGLVVGVLAVFASLVLGIAGIAWFAAGESRQRATAETASNEARRLAYRVSVGAAADAIDDHNVAAARRLLDGAPQELRGWEWRHLSTRLDNSFVQIRGTPPPGAWIQVRANGDVIQRTVRSVTYAGVRTGKVLRQIDSAQGFPIAVNRAGTMCAVVVAPTKITLNSLDETRDAPLPELTDHVRSMCFSDDGRLLAIGDAGSAVHIFDVAERRLLRTVRLTRPAFDMQFSPNSAWLAANDAQGLFIVDVEAGQVTHELSSPGFPRLPKCSWSRESDLILHREALHNDKRYYIVPFRVPSGERLNPWPAHTREISTIDLAPDGKTALIGFADGLIRICEIPGGATKLELRSAVGTVLNPIFSPDGTKIAYGELSGAIRLVDSANARPLTVLRGQEAISAPEFSADGRTLYSTAEDGMIRAWDLATADETDVLRGHTSYVYPVAFSPDGATLASGSWDATVRLWDVQKRLTSKTLKGHTGFIRSLAFSPDGRHLISVTLNGEEEFLWDIASSTCVRLPQRSSQLLDTPGFLRDGKRVWLPGNLDMKEQVYNIESKNTETISTSELRGLADARVSGDGQWIARTQVANSELTLLSLTNPAIRRTLPTAADLATFNSDGTRLVSIKQGTLQAANSEVIVWDVATGRRLYDLRGHIGEVFDARFSPDGKRLATCGRDGTIRIWDGDKFEQLVRLRGHQDYVWSVAWSPDGRMLASGSGDMTVRIWRTDQ